MTVTTIRDLIDSVADCWEKQYPESKRTLTPVFPDLAVGCPRAIATRLRSLGPDSTAAQVDAIIGNGSWTRLSCDECGDDVAAVVEVGQVGAEPDQESRTVSICLECARAAVAALTAAVMVRREPQLRPRWGGARGVGEDRRAGPEP